LHRYHAPLVGHRVPFAPLSTNGAPPPTSESDYDTTASGVSGSSSASDASDSSDVEAVTSGTEVEETEAEGEGFSAKRQRLLERVATDAAETTIVYNDQSSLFAFDDAKEVEGLEKNPMYRLRHDIYLAHYEHRLLDRWTTKWETKLRRLVKVDMNVKDAKDAIAYPVFHVPGAAKLPRTTTTRTLLASPHVHKKAWNKYKKFHFGRKVSATLVSQDRSEIHRAREMVLRAVEDQSDVGVTPEVDTRLFTTYIGHFRYRERQPGQQPTEAPKSS